MKKRTGRHENTIREFHISQNGIAIGPPLAQFQGVLRGVPEFIAVSPLKDNNP
jgi:circadian clock protein KaiC